MEVKNNKVINIILKVVTGLLIAFTVFMMVFTIVSVATLDKNERNIFGYRFYIVKTDSMSPSENNAHLDVHFSAGDIIIIKNVKDPTKMEAGDIVAFIWTHNESMYGVKYGETITHMIREPRFDSKGKLLGYVTFGTNTDTNDEALLEPEYVIGEYAGKLPGVGHFFAFVKSTPGYICCILIPFLLLILYNGADVIRLFRKYKKEQTAILDAEKAEIAAERQRNEDMLRELMALKDQLAGKAPISTPTDEQTVDESFESEQSAAAESSLTDEEIAAQKKAEAARKRKETLARKKAEAEAEAARIEAEEEEKRLAEEAAAQKKAEAARKRKETLARKKAEAEAEAARIAAEEEEKRLAEEAAAQKKAEAARKRKETLARKKAEAEAAKTVENNPDDKSDT